MFLNETSRNIRIAFFKLSNRSVRCICSNAILIRCEVAGVTLDATKTYHSPEF
jgi:hypothetical protein